MSNNQLILRINGEIVKVWDIKSFDDIPSPAELKDEIEEAAGEGLPDDTDGFDDEDGLEEDVGLPDDPDGEDDTL